MNIQELYTAALGSLLALLFGWQVARVGDMFRRRSVQLVRKHVLQTLIVTRQKGSSDYTVGSGVGITLLLVANVVATCLHVGNLRDLIARLKAMFHVNLIPLYIGARTPILAETIFGLTPKQHSLIHRSLGWVCLIEGLSYTFLSLASEQWTVKSYSFGVRCPETCFSGILLTVPSLQLRWQQWVSHRSCISVARCTNTS